MLNGNEENLIKTYGQEAEGLIFKCIYKKLNIEIKISNISDN